MLIITVKEPTIDASFIRCTSSIIETIVHASISKFKIIIFWIYEKKRENGIMHIINYITRPYNYNYITYP